MAQQGLQVIGVDLSREALKIAEERAKKKGAQVSWRHGNALSLPVDDHSVDVVNDRGCFHIISSDDRAKYAQEIARILKQGGRMLLRGCRTDYEDQHFIPITEDAVTSFFGPFFHLGPVLPLLMVSPDASNDYLEANLVVMQRK